MARRRLDRIRKALQLTYGLAAAAALGCMTANAVAAPIIYPPPPSGGLNPQLDHGVEGAQPRFKELNPDGTPNANHLYMPPKNTEATTLVDNFPWLYINMQPEFQSKLYRGTGDNTGKDVNNLLSLVESPGVPNYFMLPSTNAYGDLDYRNFSNIDVNELTRHKCFPVKVDEGECTIAGINVDLLSGFLGKALGNEAYISKSPALYERLQMNACMNQIILPMSLQPNFVFNDAMRQHNVSYNETWCQPFRTVPVDCYRNTLIPISECLPDNGERDGKMYDYRAWGYLRYAWKSVLQDDYTPSGGTGLYYGGEFGMGGPPFMTTTSAALSLGVPMLTGLTPVGVIKNTKSIPGDDMLGSPLNPLFIGGETGPDGVIMNSAVGLLFPFGGFRFTLNDLARRPVERIWDPTHPYSPRWDFTHTDRAMSELARVSDPPIQGIGFSTSTSACIVRCAAVPVDVLSFRSLAFTACINARIGINAATWWMEASNLNSDVEISYGEIFKYVCLGESLTTAVNDTANDSVLGVLENIANWPIILMYAITIPCVQHGMRIIPHAHDRIKVCFLGVCIKFPSSGIIGTAGCHFMESPPVFQKSLLHTYWNPDDPKCSAIYPINALLAKQPQQKRFDSQWPICSTKYDVQDSTIHIPECEPTVAISGDWNPIHGIRNCCDSVAHALAPLNVLKIRNTRFNPGLKPTPEGYAFADYFSNRDSRRVSPSPSNDIIWFDPDKAKYVPYASSHMPYMRWWDSGTAAGGAAAWVGIKDYDPDLDCGKYDTIVGIGTEDWDGDFSDPAKPPAYTPTNDKSKWHPAKYCRYGGNGFAINPDTGIPISFQAVNDIFSMLGFYGVDDRAGWDLSQIGIPPFYECIRFRTIDVGNRRLGPDAMTSWDELKLYQVRAIKMGLNCMPQYEKLHKPFSQEDAALRATGGSFSVPMLLNRSTNVADAYDPAKGAGVGKNGFYVLDYEGKSPVNPSSLGTNPAKPSTTYHDNGTPGNAITMRQVKWPLSWRGYVSDVGDFADGPTNQFAVHPAGQNSFPNFAGDGKHFLYELGLGPSGIDAQGVKATAGGWTGVSSKFGKGGFGLSGFGFKSFTKKNGMRLSIDDIKKIYSAVKAARKLGGLMGKRKVNVGDVGAALQKLITFLNNKLGNIKFGTMDGVGGGNGSIGDLLSKYMSRILDGIMNLGTIDLPSMPNMSMSGTSFNWTKMFGSIFGKLSGAFNVSSSGWNISSWDDIMQGMDKIIKFFGDCDFSKFSNVSSANWLSYGQSSFNWSGATQLIGKLFKGNPPSDKVGDPNPIPPGSPATPPPSYDAGAEEVDAMDEYSFGTFTLPTSGQLLADFTGYSSAEVAGFPWQPPGVSTPMGNVLGSFIGDSDYPASDLEFWPLMPGGLTQAVAGDLVYLTGEDIRYARGAAYLNSFDTILNNGVSGYYTSHLPFVAVVLDARGKWKAKNGEMRDPVPDVSDCPLDEPNCYTVCEQWVEISDSNTGKFPDVCGNTDMYGYSQPRIIYNEWLPEDILDIVYPYGTLVTDSCGHSYITKDWSKQTLRVNDPNHADNKVYWGLYNSNFGTCSDPRMKSCTFANLGYGNANPGAVNLWDHFRIYKPTWDIRQ